MGNPNTEENDKKGNDGRPISYYENNISANASDRISLTESMIKECKLDESPSQMHCLATTVPQNIAVQNIAGKHTPTRNSLRHSRMIVLHRSGKEFLPPIIRYHKFVKALLVIITFLGTVLCTLSVLLLLWTPNIRRRDNPYWSGIPVIFSGIIGLIFLYFLPKEPSEKLSYWNQSIKFASIATSLIAALASFIVSGFAVVHLIALSAMDCSPPDKITTSCLCKSNYSGNKSIFATSYHYVDLTCTEVNNILCIIIIFGCVMNTAALISEVLYLYLHWSSRGSYRYSRIPISTHLNINRNSCR